VGIYIHIPFCKSHCTYCGFYSELLPCGQGSEAVVGTFVEALCREIKQEEFRIGDTVYFGGGTPSVLSLTQLERILDTLGAATHNNLEITIEVNPDDIVRKGEEYAAGLRNMGFNRVSMGVQSLDDTLLRRMGRRHDAAEAVKACQMLRDAGFENISVDFIFGFEQGTPPIDRWLESLGHPEHVSCYQLSIEQGSGLEKMISHGKYNMPSDEECAQQYAQICELLESLGYEHYEISNWARRDANDSKKPSSLRSRHNSSYWDHTPYMGFGPGAHSMCVSDDGAVVRRWNRDDLKAYILAAKNGNFAPVRDQETLSAQQVIQESIMLGLRTGEGIPAELLDPLTLSRALSEGVLVPCENVSASAPRVRIPQSKWFVSDDIILSL